jgi:hypothetical protein
MCSEYAHSVRGRLRALPFGTRRQRTADTPAHPDPCRQDADPRGELPQERRLAGEAAPDARVHYSTTRSSHSPAYVGERLVVSGKIVDKYVRRNRNLPLLLPEVHTKEGRLVTTYNDKTLLRLQADRGA